MATYAVGDIQGCLTPLLKLLDSVEFEPQHDTLWIAGDLVNRGPDSLEALRFVKHLPHVKMVLGNHDLHLLAVAHGARKLSKKDTLNPILQAPDRDELLAWLLGLPLVHHDVELGVTMVHAGIPPIWDVATAVLRSREVEAALQGDRASATAFFNHMYGNTPSQWSDSLSGNDRLRMITNYFTRMRFCDSEGRIELQTKEGPEAAPPGFAPWFAHAPHRCKDSFLVFGHWASLMGKSDRSNFVALDTGCVWGGQLTMLRLEDKQRFAIACTAPSAPSC